MIMTQFAQVRKKNGLNDCYDEYLREFVIFKRYSCNTEFSLLCLYNTKSN